MDATSASGRASIADSGTTPLSAIVAFSNLVSLPSDKPKHVPITTSSIAKVESTSGPHSLPTEILQAIFHCVFESCVGPQNGRVDTNKNNKQSALWHDEGPLSPSLFPYALACVCLRWFWTLSMTPAYWTRLVLTADSTAAASLRTAHTAFAWAVHHPLEFILTRHHGVSLNPDSERAAVAFAMQFLLPHIDRIWSLSFHLEHSSSIPPIWIGWRGRAQHLRALMLRSRSRADDIVQSSMLLDHHPDEETYNAPPLQDVTLGDHFFKSPVMADFRLRDWFRNMTSLTICGDATSPDGNSTSLIRFLSVIAIFRSLKQLVVENIHFDETPLQGLPQLSVGSICLRRVSGKVLGVLSDTRGLWWWEDVTFSDCAINDIRRYGPGIFFAHHLMLVSMDSMATLEELIFRWNGSSLSVIDCPRLSLAFLEILEGGDMLFNLSSLRIMNCADFSVEAMIKLVQSRKMEAAAAENVFMSFSLTSFSPFLALEELSVQGRGPSISVEQAMCLADDLKTFSWDTVAQDGLRYLWDGSVGNLMVSPASGSLEILNRLSDQSLSGVKLYTA